jgi:hypothetical protein
MIIAKKDVTKLYIQEKTHAHRNHSYPQWLAIAGSLDPAIQRRTLDEKEFKTTQSKAAMWEGEYDVLVGDAS